MRILYVYEFYKIKTANVRYLELNIKEKYDTR